MTADVLDVISVGFACVATTLAWFFVRRYAREPWRETAAGQHLMKFTLGIAVVCTWSVFGVMLRLIFGLPPWLEVVLSVGRAAIFGWLCWVLWERVSLLRRSIRARNMARGRASGTTESDTNERNRT